MAATAKYPRPIIKPTRETPSYVEIKATGIRLYTVAGTRTRVFLLPDRSCWWVEYHGPGRWIILDNNTIPD